METVPCGQPWLARCTARGRHALHMATSKRGGNQWLSGREHSCTCKKMCGWGGGGSLGVRAAVCKRFPPALHACIVWCRVRTGAVRWCVHVP